ncbi:MAG: cation:dicarboxylase symporter family transporter [Verrucomicrobiales bacterium]
MATPKASLAKSGRNGHLTLWIVGAIVLAVLLAIFWPSGAIKLKLGGDLFLRLLKMLIVPLVVTSVMSGVIGLGDIRKLGKPGGVAIVYYLATTLLAVVIGIVLVNLMQPGMGLSDDQRAGIEANVASNKDSIHGKMESATSAGAKASTGGILTNLVLSLAPSNLVEHAAKMELLPLIVFSIFFAGILTTMGTKGAPLSLLIVAANDAFLKIVLLLMKAAPLGIFCLVAARFGQAQLDGGLAREFSLIGKYSLTVPSDWRFMPGDLPLIYWMVLRKNPSLFVGKCRRPC